MFNSFGNIFRLTSFGESHGKGVGGVIDGFPAGITIDEEFVQQELNRRRPGQSILTTPRKEADKVEFLSGIFEGKSTGCPIGFIVWNENQHSNDYNNHLIMGYDVFAHKQTVFISKEPPSLSIISRVNS